MNLRDKINEGLFKLHLAVERRERGLNLSIEFDPKKHPRDIKGHFRNVLDKLGEGQQVNLPDGTNVAKVDGVYHVDKRHEGEYTTKIHTVSTEDSNKAATEALDHSASLTKPESVGGSMKYPDFATAEGDIIAGENANDAAKAASLTTDDVAKAIADADPYGNGWDTEEDKRGYRELVTPEVLAAAESGDHAKLAKALNESDPYTAYPGDPQTGGHNDMATAILGQLAGKNVENTRGGAVERPSKGDTSKPKHPPGYKPNYDPEKDAQAQFEKDQADHKARQAAKAPAKPREPQGKEPEIPAKPKASKPDPSKVGSQRTDKDDVPTPDSEGRADQLQEGEVLKGKPGEPEIPAKPGGPTLQPEGIPVHDRSGEIQDQGDAVVNALLDEVADPAGPIQDAIDAFDTNPSVDTGNALADLLEEHATDPSVPPVSDVLNAWRQTASVGAPDAPAEAPNTPGPDTQKAIHSAIKAAMNADYLDVTGMKMDDLRPLSRQVRSGDLSMMTPDEANRLESVVKDFVQYGEPKPKEDKALRSWLEAAGRGFGNTGFHQQPDPAMDPSADPNAPQAGAPDAPDLKPGDVPGLEADFGPFQSRDEAVQGTEEWFQNELDAIAEGAGFDPNIENDQAVQDDYYGEIASYLPEAGQIAADNLELPEGSYTVLPNGIQLSDGTKITISEDGTVDVEEPTPATGKPLAPGQSVDTSLGKVKRVQ